MKVFSKNVLSHAEVFLVYFLRHIYRTAMGILLARTHCYGFIAENFGH